MQYEYHEGGYSMSQMEEMRQEKIENEVKIKKKVFLMLHQDAFKEEDLKPIILIEGNRIYTVFLKRTYTSDMYYVFDGKKYMKLWNDKKNNLLIYFDNWDGTMFISNSQETEYIDRFAYTTMENKLICEDLNGIKKTIELQGFDVIPLIINQFEKHANAILYILCNKLS